MSLFATYPWVTQKVESNLPLEPNWASEMILMFLLGGTLDIQVGPRQYHMNPKDFLFLKPYEVYYACHPNQNYRCLIIEIEQQALYSGCPKFDSIYFDLQLIRHSPDDSVYHSICSSLAKIVYATIKPDLCSQMKIMMAVGQILTRLIESCGIEGADSTQQTSEYTQERLASILQYIHDNYTERISLNDIAAHVGLHPQYFSVFFKKQFGSNFSDYLNRYRVGQSLPALQHTSESILNIAISNGFNSHGSYSSAFQKAYGMLPRDYRKAYQRTQNEDSAENPLDAGEGGFEFFQQYWGAEDNTFPTSNTIKTHKNIIYREDEADQSFISPMLNFVSIGRTMACLRSDIQQQLRKAKEDLHLDYVRVRDVFSDNLFLYYETEDKQPIFNWVHLDRVFDFFISIDVKPYIELGYTPSALASKKQYADWLFRPNVSRPKSFTSWALLITRFFEHYISRYGADEICKWYFAFWTNPNLELDQSYWNDSQEDFFLFYQVTYEAIRRVDPRIHIGSPNFSYPSGMDWYDNFFHYAREHDIHPDFISIHSYGIPDGQAEGNGNMQLSKDGRMPAAFQPLSPEKDLLLEQIQDLRHRCQMYGFGDLDLIISDWNVTYLPQDYTRDTCFLGPYILHTHRQLVNQVKGMCFWSLSDIHEEYFYYDTLFHGGPGLMDYLGTPKASYHALSFAYELGKEILQVGENYILAKKGQDYQLLIYNLAFYDHTYRAPNFSTVTHTQRYNVYESARTLDCHISLLVKQGKYTITHKMVNREAGSSYDIWLKMGRPNHLSHSMAEYMRSRCTPDVYIETAYASPGLSVHTQIPPHGFTLITISPND